MKFSVYLPPAADSGKVPVLYWLSGLTCTDENFLTKAGAQRVAAELGIMLVMPDTSPRGLGIEGEDDSYDFGSGAGFYVDATEPKWAKHYNMYSYVTKVPRCIPRISSCPRSHMCPKPPQQELLELVNASLPADPERSAIFGHSMGGHGALVCFLANPVRPRTHIRTVLYSSMHIWICKHACAHGYIPTSARTTSPTPVHRASTEA